MELNEAMDRLREMGTEQNMKIYGRHGARGPLFGVSFANLRKLKRIIKVDHDLAMNLWDSGNMDARTLATMIADPSHLNQETLDRMVKDLDYYLLADMFADMVSRSEYTRKKMREWMGSDEEFVRQAGYSTLSSYLKNGGDLPDNDLLNILDTIEMDIHSSHNRAKLAMNNAVIAVGTYSDDLVDKAFEVAERIGNVAVDHGQTSCKTPDIIPYIKKARAHRKR